MTSSRGLMPPPSSISESLSGILQLIEDLHRLSEDKEYADIEFVVGERDQTIVLAHSLILRARCANFNELKSSYEDRSRISRSPITCVLVMPKVKVDEFQSVIQYIYTGKIHLHPAIVFEVLSLAHEFGISELKLTCEDHIMSAMTNENACVFLKSALQVGDRSEKFKDENAVYIDKCTTFICENAAECLKTPAFLQLPKNAVILLVSSDYLCMNEDDVWRAVLNWAKHQAKVSSEAEKWTDQERKSVGDCLEGVINHVRILLINSQVYAEEVEPTRLVSMELSLERYRNAALQKKIQPEARILKPRASERLFPGSHLLSGPKLPSQQQLNNWFGNPYQVWRLLHRASNHGYKAQAFHEDCDDIAPLFVVVLGTSGQLCGGFTDVPFARTNGRRCKYSASEKAFLFSLVNAANLPPTRFDIQRKMFAILSDANFGPIFGAGADLSIADECNISMESYSNFPHTFGGEGASCTLLMGDYNFTVLDYEVFTLAHPAPRSNRLHQRLHARTRELISGDSQNSVDRIVFSKRSLLYGVKRYVVSIMTHELIGYSLNQTKLSEACIRDLANMTARDVVRYNFD
ncbi:uncharacterized protein LOC100898299 [Galendromus occidentalis]|uniref:Uncharacterized protein LOC100898299 n=1 Tax=Galendromus occidentalis TaxID=34638 RepID=A0AAJ6QN21_9ACAR|nr:uncharacterized protein LOC100898299 [Galendromus occidentalis]